MTFGVEPYYYKVPQNRNLVTFEKELPQSPIPDRYYHLLSDKFTACPPPCKWMDVKLGWPDRSNYSRFPDASYLRMYFTTRVKAKNTAEDYPASSLVSDIGGYVGLMVRLNDNRVIMIVTSSGTPSMVYNGHTINGHI